MSKTFEQLEPVISALDKRIKTNLEAYPTDTAEGLIASFSDGADGAPVKSLVVGIEPVQSGEGAPSPTNVRPISGWTGAMVARTGKNLFDKTATETDNGYVKDKYITDKGEVASSSNNNVSEYVAVKPSTTYTLSGTSGMNPSLVFYDSEKQYISGIKYNTNTSITFTTPHNAEYVRMSIPVAKVDVFQLELGSTATEYESYVSNTHLITFPSEAGTVYGGTLDVTNGVLTVDRAMVDLGTVNWSYDTTGAHPVFYSTFDNKNMKLRSANTQNGITNLFEWINVLSRSDMCAVAETGVFSTTITGVKNNLIIRDDRYTNTTDFTTAMNGVQLCYELATPVTYQLTPTEVKSLLGQNNIWADTGDTSVTYRADTTTYINRKIAEAISALS